MFVSQVSNTMLHNLFPTMLDGMSLPKIVVSRHHNIIMQCAFVHVGLENITMGCCS
jgi:hypothetical protein